MLQKYFILLLLLIGTSFSGCKKEDISYKSDFEKSLKEWEKFKKNSGNSYQYTVLRSSWVGMSFQTIITVKKGKVVQRKFTWIVPVDWMPEIPEDQREWTENENEINAHKDSGASDAITLDEVYDKAKNDWLKKRDNVTTYFEAKNNGLISSCGYVEDNCADDCFIGINITSITRI